MGSTLQDVHWDNLVRSIAQGRCTPFLGAGANTEILPLGGEVARQWARRYDYPLEDDWDLASVSQFFGIDSGNPMAPKDQIIWELRKTLNAWLSNHDLEQFVEARKHPISVLSQLPFPVFITTNYDDLLLRTLKKCRCGGDGDGRKDPRWEICLWNKWVRDYGGAESELWGPERYEPTPAHPLVYHLHGHMDVPESLVLTESDYLDFLVNVTRDQNHILPPRIQRAMAAADLLFVGYSMADWSFRVLLRGAVESLMSAQKRGSVAVQLPPDVPDEKRDKVLQYLQNYLGSIGGITVTVYWGNAMDFVGELYERWQDWET